jgi:hypothetical protein
MSAATRGWVDLELGDETLTLKPTLDAMLRIERHFGGVRNAAVQVQDLSLTTLCQIIAAGAGLDKAEAKALPEKVFEAGIATAAGPVAEFLGALLNPGGDDEGK